MEPTESSPALRPGRPRPSTLGRQTSARRAYVLLRAGIRSELLGRHEQLSEDALTAALETSRNAVRKALQNLADDGLLRRSTKVGTRIVGGLFRIPVDQRMLVRNGDGAPASASTMLDVQLLESRAVKAAAYVRHRLQTDQERVRMSEFLVCSATGPLSVWLSYTGIIDEPVDIVMSQPDRAAAFHSRFGVTLGHSEDTIESVACDARTAVLLEVPEGSPVLLTETVSFDVSGRARELMFQYNRGDRVAVTTVTDHSSPISHNAPHADT